MKRILISMTAVALLSVGICVFSLLFTRHVCGEIDDMRIEVMNLLDQGDISAAHLTLQQLAEAWREYEPTLEILVRHDDLHKIAELIIEADANLEAEDQDDLTRSMALLGEALRHLTAEEELRLSNIL